MDAELIKQEAARLYHKYVDPTSPSPLKLSLLPKTAAGIEQGLAVPSQELFRSALEEGARLRFFIFFFCCSVVCRLYSSRCSPFVIVFRLFCPLQHLLRCRHSDSPDAGQLRGLHEERGVHVAMGALLLNERYHVPDAFFKHFLTEYCQAGDDSWQLIEEKVRSRARLTPRTHDILLNTGSINARTVRRTRRASAVMMRNNPGEMNHVIPNRLVASSLIPYSKMRARSYHIRINNMIKMHLLRVISNLLIDILVRAAQGGAMVQKKTGLLDGQPVLLVRAYSIVTAS